MVEGGRPSEHDRVVVDPQQQLIVGIGEPQLHALAGRQTGLGRDGFGGLLAGAEAVRLLTVEDTDARHAAGQVDHALVLHAGLDDFQQQLAAIARRFHVGLQDQIADPVQAIIGDVVLAEPQFAAKLLQVAAAVTGVEHAGRGAEQVEQSPEQPAGRFLGDRLRRPLIHVVRRDVDVGVVGVEVGDRSAFVRIDIAQPQPGFGPRPLLQVGGAVEVAQPFPLIAGGIDLGPERAVDRRQFPRIGRRGGSSRLPRLPWQRVASFIQPGRLVIGVVDVVGHRQQFLRRLAEHLEVAVVDRCDPLALTAGSQRPRVDVAVMDQQGLARQADDPFDVVLFWIAGKFEHGHVPALGIRQGVGELADQDAVTAEVLIGGVAGQVERVDIATVGANPADDGRSGTRLDACADLKLQRALGAEQILVLTHQRGGHRAGGDHKRFGDEGAKQQGEDDRHRDRLDGFAVGGHANRLRPRRLRAQWRRFVRCVGHSSGRSGAVERLFSSHNGY